MVQSEQTRAPPGVAEAEAGSIALLSATSKYRLLERYVARNVNDEK